MLADNNKAQRNLWTAPGAGGGGGGGGGWMAHAVIRNDQRESMQIPLVYRIPHDLFKRFEGATIGVAGGEMQPLRERGEIVLPTLRHGETRVLLVNLGRFNSEPGELLPIEFSEMIGGRVRNGFTIAATTWPLPLAAMRDDIDPKTYRDLSGRAGEGRGGCRRPLRPRERRQGSAPPRPGVDEAHRRGKGSDDETLAAAHQAFLDLLDAAITQASWERRKE